ncbi:MAG: hypothetical protein ACK4U0_05700 [Mesorhizobium sp.]
MIKFIVAAVWIIGVTIGTIFVSYSMNGQQPVATGDSPYHGKLEFVKTDMLSVPVVQEGAVKGYFLSKLVYAADVEKLKRLALPIDTLLVDEVYTFLFSNPSIDFSRVEGVDLNAMRNGLKDSINRRVGDDLIYEIMVEQVDYLTKEQIRDNALKRRDAKGGKNRPTFNAGSSDGH